MSLHRPIVSTLATLLLLFTAHCARVQPGSGLVSADIFRGVDAAANGTAKLNPGTFRYNPNLSTFDATGATAKCWFRFTVDNLPNVQPGVQGPVNGMPGYIADFNNVPPGHWDIIAPIGTATAAAAAATSQYAQNNRLGRVVNGSQNNCR